MDKYGESKPSRSRWKDDNRNPKLYDERTDKAGSSTIRENGKTRESKRERDRLNKTELVNTINQNLPEDVRISKLLRRLETEGTTTGLIEICEKLKHVVQDPLNGNYIRRSFDILANSVTSVMKDCSGEALPHLSEVFGLMGYASYDFPTYKSWICKTYKSTKSLRPAMMNSLEKTLQMDRNTSQLSEQIARLMELLRDFLEQSDVTETFIAITKVLMVIAQNYNKFFKPHFTNIVDIIVGWHLEQKSKVKIHCSVVLQSFQQCWQADSKFTLDLLGQLLEDIDACYDRKDEAGDSIMKKLNEFGSFVGVYNTIIKCILTSPDELAFFVTKPFLEESYEKIQLVGKHALKESYDEEIVMSVNEFLLIIIECRKCEVEIEMNDIQEIIELELQKLNFFNEVQLASFFTLLIKFIDEYKATLTIDFIDKLFDLKGPLVTTVRFNNDSRVKNGLIRMYHDILALKNVPILQAAYKYIINDFGACLREIPELNDIKWEKQLMSDELPENSKTSILMAQYSLNFNLTAVATLATIQNSIIAMYSLTPSILEVLINLQIWRKEWTSYDLTQFSVLKLISAHCLKNNNFVSSSSLFVTKSITSQSTSSWLSASSPTESPVSQHFKLILEFLCKMVKSSPSLKQMILMLDWLDKIIQQTSQFSEVLIENQDFVFIIKRINNIAVKYNDLVSLKVATCNDSLYAHDHLNPEIYTSIVELCGVQMCSVNAEIRKRYSFILSRVPLRYTLEQAKAASGINLEAVSKKSEMESWYLSLGALHGGELRAQYFQEFINNITFSPEAKNIDEFILRAFKNCWFNGNEMAEEYKRVTLKDIRTLTSWIQWEAARFCVNNKLRTPLGKPQDTFVKIENIIKEHARILALKDKSKLNNYKHVLANQRNVRILLGFMEALEKSIYNAAEGNAFGIPPPEKPAKTFFRLNASTCNEWFLRNRLALHLLALHCMELEMVIRCSTSVLRDMADAGKFNEPYFEQMLMSLVWAYLRNYESDALFGVYTWTKNVTGKKLLWIKMAAEQAAGHREVAADGYTKILKDEKLEPAIYDFINDQRKLSLLYSGDFVNLYQIVAEEEMRYFKPENIPILTISAEQLASYVRYDKTKDPVVLYDLTQWELLEKGPNVSSNFSVHRLVSLTENTLSHALLGKGYYSDDNQESCWDILHTLLQECARTGSQEYLNYLTMLNHLSHKSVEHKDLNGFKNIESFEIKKKYGMFTMFMATAWSEFFDDYSQKGEQQNINLRMDFISYARKELNYRQCEREMETVYKKIEYIEHIGFPYEAKSLEVIKDFMMSEESISNPKVWNKNVSRAAYEHCKFLYIAQQQHSEAIQFAASSAYGINHRLLSADFESEEKLKQQCVKFYVKISEWIQCESDDILNSEASPLNKLVQSINDEYHVDEKMPLIDAAVGKLLQSGVKKCPEMSKVWSALGSWCYRWGRKMVESKTDSHGLRPVDCQAIVELLPEAQENDIENILKILNEQHIAAEDEDIGPNESSSTEMIESQLRMIPLLTDKNSEFLDAIIELWKQAHREVYRYYEMCASSYFKFLLLSKSNLEDSGAGDSSVVTATLRLLRLIVKHALGLQEVLEEGLSKTPSDPWKVIIPQLFSRLNHHEPYVRRRVSELLCRVAIDSPHLIIFPTVVGAKETLDVAKIADEEEKNPETEWRNSSLTFCFNSLLNTLSMQSPETVNQVQLLVGELRRIALLWDELWLLSLSQVYAENVKKFQMFEVEFQKTDQSTEKIILFTEKYRLLMRPILFVLERLHEWTSRAAETNNERNFQEKFSNFIAATITDMKKPFDPSDSLAAFNKFKSLYQVIQHRVHKRINYSLKMSDVSPILANLRNTSISMPGVQPSYESEAVYIQSVDNTIQILPTKTKPKKLAFYGSDGKRYTYLFKGMEDLHLDERIMQFLSIANLMMKRSVDSDGKVTHYRAHHYSVIPLGPRSGLISWVDSVTPIFSIYKKWQQREALNPRKDKQYVVVRPSEMYYNKITPLLKEHNLKPGDNRKDWPTSVQRKAFEELKAETPKDLLSKEFWCTASTAAQWRLIVRNYSVSLAVMSVIGYVIGLGDRHLDNILVKLASGDVVHIDYNVCFEKGKTLRVPEKVPFRMTQNIEEALGLTGIEGTFRLSCEHVLKSLKRGRETLLTLLEAFVYDPLVDWAVGEDNATGGLANLGAGGEKGAGNTSTELTAARKQLEREVTRDTLAIRFTEIKEGWIQNRDDVYNQLLLMKTYLNDLSLSREEIQRLESQRNQYSNQISMVRELEALGSAMSSHPLNTLSQRYAVYKKKRNDVALIENILMEKAVESERLIADYLSFVDDSRSGRINNESNHVAQSSLSEFDLVKEFLEGSNQGQTYIQSEQFRKELDNATKQQQQIIESAVSTLVEYFNISSFYPNDHVMSHRFTKYSKWCRSLIDNKTQDFVRQIAMAYHSSFGDAIIKELIPENILLFNYQLQTFLVELTYQRDINIQRYQQSCAEQLTAGKSFNAMKEELRSKSQTEEKFSAFELSKLTKRLLALEASLFSASSEHLADLVVNDRWFIDEFHIQSSFISNIVDCEAQKRNVLLNNSFECFKSVTENFETFIRIKNEFQLNVIPQTLKGIISKDKSVLEMISSLSNIQSLKPLTELAQHLQEDLHNDIQSSDQSGLAELTSAYNGMVVQYESMTENSVGKKLFLSLHGMFVDMDRSLKKTLSFDKALSSVPDEWKKIHEIEQAMNLFISSMKQVTLETLEQILFIKRIQAMIEFFSCCLQIAWSFKGSGVLINFDLEFLARPMKVYIAECFSRCVIGRGSFNSSIITCCLLDLKSGELKCLSLDQMSFMLSSNSKLNEKVFNSLDEQYRKEEAVGYLKKLDRKQTEYVKHLTHILSAHHWLHEDYFIAHSNALPPVPRATLLIQLQTFIQSLSSVSTLILKINEELMKCTMAVLQRLKWASGANPMLNDLMKSFEAISNSKSSQLEKDQKRAAFTLKHCYSVLNYEMLRFKTPKAIISDEEFLNFVQQWENVCVAERNVAHTVNKIEEALVELLDPEGKIERAWINNVTSLIDDMINQVHSDIDAKERSVTAARDNLDMCAHKLRSFIASHHRISADIRNLLKSILKHDDSDRNNALRDYLVKYKTFIENVTELHGNVLSKDFTDSMVKRTIEQVDVSLAIINEIYNDLFSFEKTLKTTMTDGSQRQMLRNQSENLSTEMLGSPIKKASNQKEQKRNAYAVSVWRRIRMKLEGRDPDPNKSSRVHEQVDWMIREALNQDNLALLYEGFTSWV